MQKIIFLDIDGVIATPESLEHGMWALVDSKQELLGEILKATGAKIVLSSSWRYNSLEATKENMSKKGFKFTEDIIGVTIRAYQYVEKFVHLSIPRGVEIKQWIDINLVCPWIGDSSRTEEFREYTDKGHFIRMRSNIQGVDYKYVIIDDDSDMLLEHKDYFIKTISDEGLTEKHVQKAIKILGKI